MKTKRTAVLPKSAAKTPTIKLADKDLWEKPKEAISPMWDDVKPEDIGAGFRPASKESKRILLARHAVLAAQREHDNLAGMTARDRMQMQADKVIERRYGAGRHPFLNGNNKFIFYIIKVDVKSMADAQKAKKKAKTKVDYANPIPQPAKQRFVGKMKKAIDHTANFLWSEILPVTNSMLSAVQKVDDFSKQTLDEGAGVPTEYIKRKMMDAVHLRVIRHVADQFNLTKEERVLFTSEFRAKIAGF